LRRDLSKRFGNLKDGAADIKNHRFFEDINFDDLLKKKLSPPFIP
jgi:protein kinase A